MRKCALLLTGLLLGFAPAPLPRPPKPDNGKDDLKKMEGTWEVTSLIYEGRPLAPSTFSSRVAIAGGWLTYSDAKGNGSSKWALTIDAKKAPRTFDMTPEGGSRVGGWGIYAFKGEKLVRCLSIRSAAERPAEFDGNRPGRYLQVLERAKR